MIFDKIEITQTNANRYTIKVFGPQYLEADLNADEALYVIAQTLIGQNRPSYLKTKEEVQLWEGRINEYEKEKMNGSQLNKGN